MKMMITKKPIIASGLAIALLILGATGIPAFDRSALAAVTLASFTATGGDGQVLIEWETASEVDNIGFNLCRSTSEGGTYARLNDSLIPSQALGSVVGAYYCYTDSDVINGTTYYYKLECVDVYGGAELYGPIAATPRAQPTATPTAPTATPIGGTITDVRMSYAPGGPAVTWFPSGTSMVYVVIDYSDMHDDEFLVRVYDIVGNLLFEQVKFLMGSGTDSTEVLGPGGEAFPDGRYLTYLYSGLFPIETVAWEVTADVPTSTPTPPGTPPPTGVPTLMPYRVYLPVILKNYTSPTLPTPTPTDTPTATATPPPCLDGYEPDDTWQQSRLIEVDWVTQSHNFHTTDDRDYVKFVAEADHGYIIRTLNLSAGNDTTLTLYDTDGTTQLEYNDDDPQNPPASEIVWLCPTTGTYFVKAAPFGTQIGGCDVTYDLRITSAPASTSKPTAMDTSLPMIIAW
jgi:hypothetical protein